MNASKTQQAIQEALPPQELPPSGEAGPLVQAQVRRTSGLGDVVERRRAVRAVRQAGSARKNGEPGQRGTQLKTVVVIDDEVDQVDLTVLLLQSAGHRAVGATDGSQAVAMVAREGAEVVVCDFMLAGMTGGDVCTALRTEPTTCQVRIVMLSGTPEAEIRRSCQRYDVYLTKPVDSAALFQAIQ